MRFDINNLDAIPGQDDITRVRDAALVKQQLAEQKKERLTRIEVVFSLGISLIAGMMAMAGFLSSLSPMGWLTLVSIVVVILSFGVFRNNLSCLLLSVVGIVAIVKKGQLPLEHVGVGSVSPALIVAIVAIAPIIVFLCVIWRLDTWRQRWQREERLYGEAAYLLEHITPGDCIDIEQWCMESSTVKEYVKAVAKQERLLVRGEYRAMRDVLKAQREKRDEQEFADKAQAACGRLRDMALQP